MSKYKVVTVVGGETDERETRTILQTDDKKEAEDKARFYNMGADYDTAVVKVQFSN